MPNKLTENDIINKIPSSSYFTFVRFSKRDKNNVQLAIFKCRCGNEKEIRPGYVLYGSVKSCGCLSKESTSQRFRYTKDIILSKLPIDSRLTPLEDTGKIKAKNHVWLFKCSCGNTLESIISSVVNGNTKSCGCLQKEHTSRLGKEQVKHLRSNNIHRERLLLDVSLQEAYKRRSYVNIKRNKKKQCKCEYCGKFAKTQDHHITAIATLQKRFLSHVPNKTYFQDSVINHPRNLISLCPECHLLVHKPTSFDTDPEITKVFKAIKRFSLEKVSQSMVNKTEQEKNQTINKEENKEKGN